MELEKFEPGNTINAPLRCAYCGTELSGSHVELIRSNGQRSSGLLINLNATDRCVELRDPDKGQEHSVPFDDFLYLRFIDTPRIIRSPVSGETFLKESFHVLFNNGESLSGMTTGYVADTQGLHLFPTPPDQWGWQWFLPYDAIEHYRVGHMISKPVNSGAEAGDTMPSGPLSNRHSVINESTPIENSSELREVLNSRMADWPGIISDQHLAVDASASAGAKGPVTVAMRLHVPYVKLHNFDIDEDVLALVPEEFARTHLTIPLLLESGHLVVAMENPSDVETVQLLRFMTKHHIEPCIATREDIEEAVDRHYSHQEDADVLEALEVEPQQESEHPLSRQDTERIGKEKPVVRFVTHVLLEAIHRNASDIHIRPGLEQADLLFRIDGMLVLIRHFNKTLLPAVVARIKIISQMNIAEHRLPQDGRARVIDHGRLIDLRLSVMPTVNGESVVIRILDTSAGLRSIGELGFSAQDAEHFTDLLHKSYGMLLVTGPTGSGKSTTLYAALQEIREQNVNIITVEDPVEYHIEGIEQIQVNKVPGYTFARALRQILRHDPDVIMVGEIRDQETGKIAVEAALTGHLVLSTLHTNDAPSTVTRLLEMGVESYLLNSCLLGVLAQRLVRRNCPHCVEVEQVDSTVRKFLGVSSDEVFYRGTGCSECNDTGYHGRMAVYELLTMTAPIRNALQAGVTAETIRQLAVKDGMVSLTSNALGHARRRTTSLAEVYRVRLE